MSDLIFKKYMEKKKEADEKRMKGDEMNKSFEDLLDKLLSLDVNFVEKFISRLVIDKFIITLNGNSCKLDDKSIDLVKKIYKNVSDINKNNLSNVYQNVYVQSFVDDQIDNKRMNIHAKPFEAFSDNPLIEFLKLNY